MNPAPNAPDAATQGDDVRPIVATGSSGKIGIIAFTIVLLLGGGWIISVMSDQRAARGNTGPLGDRSAPTSRIASPLPLALPNDFGDRSLDERRQLPPAQSPEEQAREIPVSYAPEPSPRAIFQPAPSYAQYPSREAFRPPEPQATFSAPPTPAPPQPALQSEAQGSARVTAARFEKPSRTVPQGTVIPAVLETALDSTRPGGVRALVQRDIHAFDGSRVLIPRGSRLYGEYDAQLQRGEKRALVRWTRLIRPDGVTIALDSPASDPLGRAGVKGKVDSKFFQRFGGALLQSVLDIGVGVATREATDGVIVALPGSTQNVTPRIAEGEVRPTLKVRHGTSVSVFVARDLDFSTVEP